MNVNMLKICSGLVLYQARAYFYDSVSDDTHFDYDDDHFTCCACAAGIVDCRHEQRRAVFLMQFAIFLTR